MSKDGLHTFFHSTYLIRAVTCSLKLDSMFSVPDIRKDGALSRVCSNNL